MHEEYLRHFPNELSGDIKKYAIEEAMKFSRYIFTSRIGKKQYGYCTHCKTTFPTDGLRRNYQETINWGRKKQKVTAECPNCKSQCIVKQSGRDRKYMIDEAIFEYYEKSIVNPAILIAREIRVTRDYRASYENVKANYSTLALYIFEMGKSVMLKRNYWGEDFYVTGSVYSNTLDKLPYKCSYTSISDAVKNTHFQYSTWDSYTCNNSSMVKFFDLYSKYPCIEYLTKEGFKELVLDKLWGRNTYSAINWKADSIFKILKLNKVALKELRKCKYKDDSLFLRLYQISIKDKSNLSLEEIGEIRNRIGFYFKELQSIHKYVTLRKIFNYAKQQEKKYPKQFERASILITWEDYLADCKTLEMNLKDEQVLFPKNLYVAHQNTISQIKIKENEQFDIKIKKRAKSLGKYKFEYSGLIIRPVESSAELIKEGQILHHCVGTYAKRYSDGETNIFTIRKIDNLDKPYFTLELRKNEIVQIHGKNNCNPKEDVKAFIEAFKVERLTRKQSENKMSVPA